MVRIINILLIFLLTGTCAFAQNVNSSFKIVPLGVKGGIGESNLSAYMVAPNGSTNYICLDAGTLHYGIEKTITNKVFNIPAEQVLKSRSHSRMTNRMRRFSATLARWLMKELDELEQLSGLLNGFNLVVTHVKPPQKSIDRIKKQSTAENHLHLHLIYPQQGKALEF